MLFQYRLSTPSSRQQEVLAVQPSELIWSQDVIHPVFGSMKAGAYNPNNIWNTEKG
jgi:hypothetical protein